MPPVAPRQPGQSQCSHTGQVQVTRPSQPSSRPARAERRRGPRCEGAVPVLQTHTPAPPPPEDPPGGAPAGGGRTSRTRASPAIPPGPPGALSVGQHRRPGSPLRAEGPQRGQPGSQRGSGQQSVPVLMLPGAAVQQVLQALPEVQRCLLRL